MRFDLSNKRLLFLNLSMFSPVCFAATVSVVNPPSTIAPGQSLNVSVRYSKTAADTEKRVVVRLDLFDAADDTTVAQATANNGGTGYTGNTGTINCPITIPANASGSYYFRATLAPWSLNRAIVAQYKSYPTDGTFTYLWSGGGMGVTQNVYYLGSLIARKPSGNTCYCSGLAFETFVIPFNAYNMKYGHSRIGNIQTASNMETFRRRWYGTEATAEKLAVQALPEWGAGVEITDFEEAQEGDFVQLWRRSGNGHNPLFVNWIRNQSNQITGVHYWGTQGSTDGIGYNDENFGVSSGLNRDRFYIGRAAKPRDQADYDWALGQVDTKGNLSSTNTSVEEWREY